MNATPHDGSYFVSDLHLFSRRSTGDLMLAELQRRANEGHTIVLGGDIFDFKWSSDPCPDRTLNRAEEWLQKLIEQNEHCEFHYVLGNHDSHPLFVERLRRLTENHSGFQWHRYFARLDHCLFLHGDVADGSLDHARLDARRERMEKKKRRHPMLHYAYDLAIHARLHRLAILSIREIVVLNRIRQYAQQIGHGPDEGITDVYFGHTHFDLDGVDYQGLTFHNGGAAIKGLRFRIVPTSLSSPAKRRA
ncbi:metallophosphoesterase [Roseiconus lacunae]|uniref:metallophosphoesterase n=1 Tax=Roseiconus lacunae TaxID=2605694 RepID=UPI00308E402D|nr:metallophosphoesterase [Stieleria sp. HD01]